MIIEIKIANYRSIHAEQTLSFVAERGTRHKDNLIQRPGYRLMKAAGLFGANASGKSNFVRAIGEMRDFVRDSATKMNDGDPIICAQPYRLDPESRTAPSRFEITFVIDNTIYTYGFAATRERVHEEWLRTTPEGKRKETVLFERSLLANARSTRLQVHDSLKSIIPMLIDRTRENALMLSTAARENVKELLPIYRYIRDYMYVLDILQSLDTITKINIGYYDKEELLREFAQQLLRDADTGIESFRVEDRKVKTCHRASQDNIVEFDLDNDESMGTQKFLSLLVPFYYTLLGGRFLVIDELDASMHPLLTRKLLELFQSPEANPNGAQLLFTTHDPSLLDQELFRRDQIWLAEKHAGASTFYSLADIKPSIRSTESFLRNYLTGRYGGTPHLGPAFDSVLAGKEA